MRNQSGVFLGLLALTITIDGIGDFLAQLDGTPGTKFAALDGPRTVVATTAPQTAADAPVLTETIVIAEAANPPANCASSYTTASPETTRYGILCRPYAASHSYAPLRAVAADRAVTRPAAGVVVLTHVSTDGDGDFIVAGAGIRNGHTGFPLSVLAFVPEADVLGGVYAARNIALAVVCVIFLAACGLSFAVIALVLRPLQTVSRNMTRTARLKDVTERDEERRSALREVYDLQSAYSGMNTAMKSFTRYVPRDVVKDLMASGQLCEIAMKPMWCTMLFSDIAGFTSICERVPPDELSALVSSYFGSMSAIVMRHGGVIDKFIGDAIMAVWGAPFPVGNQEARATLCAFLMELESRGAELGGAFDAAGEHLAIRVGVATGTVLAGNMGSAERMNYTVIGDDVNLAARLEALNKQFGTRVMVAEATARALPAGVFAVRLLHRIQVVGKEQPVAVYEVLGLREGAVNAAVMTRLKDADEVARANDPSASYSGSDLASVASAISEHPGSHDAHSGTGRDDDDDSRRKDTQPMARLLEAAYRADKGSNDTVASADRTASAERHEAALAHFAAMRFAECIAALRGDGAPPPAPTITTPGDATLSTTAAAATLDAAGELLLEQAERCLAHPATGEFTAVWRATEK